MYTLMVQMLSFLLGCVGVAAAAGVLLRVVLRALQLQLWLVNLEVLKLLEVDIQEQVMKVLKLGVVILSLGVVILKLLYLEVLLGMVIYVEVQELQWGLLCSMPERSNQWQLLQVLRVAIALEFRRSL